MATLTIRDLDDALKGRLRVRAAENGRSMEAEVRAILRSVLTGPSGTRGLGSRIQRRFAGVEDGWLVLPERSGEFRAAELPE